MADFHRLRDAARTAAQYYGPRVVGVILTGMLNDGTVGLLEVKRRGGLAVVQDQDEALYPSMPESAMRYVEVDDRLPLKEIAPRLVRLTTERALKDGNGHAVSHQLSMESKFASLHNLDKVETMDTIGKLAAYSCPECHGPMWRMNGEGPIRFRCHVGHGYTAETLETGQAEATESNLWSVLRTLEERAALLRELTDRARELNQPGEAANWEARIGCLEEDMLSVRAVLVSGKSTEGVKKIGA